MELLECSEFLPPWDAEGELAGELAGEEEAGGGLELEGEGLGVDDSIPTIANSVTTEIPSSIVLAL